MKFGKLSAITSAVIVASLSTTVFAGHHEEKITQDFNSLDKDGNGYIIGSEASGVFNSKLMSKMDMDGDSMISRKEFNTLVDVNPTMFSNEIITELQTNGTNDAVMTKRGHVEAITGTDGDVIAEKNKEMRSEEIRDAKMRKHSHGKALVSADGEIISEHNKELRSELSATANEKFTRLDANSDGKLTEEELSMTDSKGDFSEIDKDDDQYITRVEYRAFFKQMETE